MKDFSTGVSRIRNVAIESGFISPGCSDDMLIEKLAEVLGEYEGPPRDLGEEEGYAYMKALDRAAAEVADDSADEKEEEKD